VSNVHHPLPRGSRRLALCVGAIVALLAGPGPAPAGAVEPISVLTYSPDITVALGGTTVAPGDVADDDLVQPPALLDIGPGPADANLTGYHRLPDGDQLLSFDVTVSLGGLTVEPRDVVRTNGVSYALVFSGAARDVPDGVAIDAIAMIGDDLLLSFNVDVTVNGFTAADADVVRFDGATFSPFFDAAAAGVPRGLDLDALHYLDNGHLLVSFDGSGTVGGVTFDDEDVLAYDPALHTWTLVYDGSAAYPQWAAADLDALSAAPPATIPTATGTPAATPTPTVEVVATTTFTPAPGATDTATATGVFTATHTASQTPTGTSTASATPKPTQSATPTATPTPTPETCVGACSVAGAVTVDDILKLVNISLNLAPPDSCSEGNPNGGQIETEDLIVALKNLLVGCPK
jgi:hypothetical protein